MFGWQKLLLFGDVRQSIKAIHVQRKQVNEMFVDDIRDIDTFLSDTLLRNGGHLSTSKPELQKLYREGSIVKLVTFASKKKEPRL